MRRNILIAVAIIAALVLLVEKTDELVSGLKDLGKNIGIIDEYCKSVDIKVRSYNFIPYYLNRTIKHRHYKKDKELLYWILIKANNNCFFDDVNLSISYKLTRGDIYAGVTDKKTTFKISARESITQTADPQFFIRTSEERTGEVEIKWEARSSDANVRIDQGTTKLIVEPRNLFYWDWKEEWRLQNGNWEPIPKDFLLASLSAWTMDNHKVVLDAADKLNQRVVLSIKIVQVDAFIRMWIKSAYTELLLERKMKLIMSSVNFPVNGPMTIQLASTLLDSKKTRTINPIELALTLGALTRKAFVKTGHKYGLLLMPDSANPSRKSVYFWWGLTDKNIRALNMGRNGSLDFDDNVEQSTKTVKKELDAHPKILHNLDKTGIHFEDSSSIIAINFIKAVNQYAIRKIR